MDLSHRKKIDYRNHPYKRNQHCIERIAPHDRLLGHNLGDFYNDEACNTTNTEYNRESNESVLASFEYVQISRRMSRKKQFEKARHLQKMRCVQPMDQVKDYICEII